MRDSMTRSSSPSYRPATSIRPGSCRKFLASACVNGTPCADIYIRGDPAGCRAAAASIAFDIGSGFSTIPGPPPYGRSSTVRCTSRGVRARVLTIDAQHTALHRPAQHAELQRLLDQLGEQCHDFDAHESCQKSSGQSTTTAARVLVDAAQVLRGHRYPVLPLALDHHHRVARRVDEMIDHSQQRTFQIPHLETDQVVAIVFAPFRRRQRLAIDENHLPGQPARGVAFLDTLEPRDPAIALRPRLQQLHFASGAFAAATASAPLEQSLRRIGERLHPQPAAHAVRRSQSADFNAARFLTAPPRQASDQAFALRNVVTSFFTRSDCCAPLRQPVVDARDVELQLGLVLHRLSG